MRNIIAYTCISLYGLGLLKPIAPYIEFELNKGYIQEFLCVNKNEPITVCGGQCYLAKELKQAAEKGTQSIPTSIKINLNDYPIGFVELTAFDIYAISKKSEIPHAENQYFHQASFSIFHPPRS